MSYRHTIYRETEAYERLGKLASAVAAQKLALPYTPMVCFFKEDPNGSYQRPIRCSGFIDHHSHPIDLDVFVRSGLSPAETVKTIWHEVAHICDHVTGAEWSREDGELRASAFARTAPAGSNLVEELEAEYQTPSRWESRRQDNLRWAREVEQERRENRLSRKD